MRRPRLEQLEPRMMLSGVPYGAHQQDTAEYMLGDVVATVVLFESNGSIDPNTEDWNQLVRDNNGDVVFDEFGRTISVSGPNLIEEVKDKVKEGLTWWQDTLANFGSWQDTPTPTPVHSLNFTYDFQYAHNPIDTGYEPIARRSNDYVYWAEDFLKEVGYDTFNSLDVDIRAFNDSQRAKYDADWAYTIFVVNDHNDADGRFAPGGSFQRAFAFAGGRFFVAPSRRPSSTFAHETGHMFWARDEYAGGGSYTDRRGYYDTQNWNAADNPAPGFVQQDSLMASGTLLDNAFARHVSSESSLAMIGWQDSDADGVFDVLDVPLTLTGSGYYDPAHNAYRFVGRSTVQTLPNQNASGLRDDITINEVSQAEYSTDGGATWQVAREYHTYEANLDLTIPLQPGQELLIRTRDVDQGTGLTVATSATTFHGNTTLPTSVDDAGIEGFVWHDQDDDATWDPGEPGLSGWTVQLVDEQGQPLDLTQVLEPDDYSEGQRVNDVLTGVTLAAFGYGTTDDRVGAVSASTASTGQRVLGYVRAGTLQSWGTEWNAESRRLRITFDVPVAMVSLDAVAPNRDAYGRLEAYDENNRLLERYTTQRLTNNRYETMTLIRDTPDIAYVIAGSTKDTAVVLDNLRVGPEAMAVTDTMGAYAMHGLPSGLYHVQAVAPAHWLVTAPAAGIHDVVVLPDGSMQDHTGPDRLGDFAGQRDANAFPWQNPRDPLDVDDQGSVIPLDALIVINELNANGSHELPAPSPGHAPPPYLDVSGDNYVSPLDALLIINYLNSQPATGPSGEAPAGAFGGGASGAEGEAWWMARSGHAGSRPAVDSNVGAATALDIELPSRSPVLLPPASHPDSIAAWSQPIIVRPWGIEPLGSVATTLSIAPDLFEQTRPSRLREIVNQRLHTGPSARYFQHAYPGFDADHSTLAGPGADGTMPAQGSNRASAKRDAEPASTDLFELTDRWGDDETVDIIANEIARRIDAIPSKIGHLGGPVDRGSDTTATPHAESDRSPSIARS